LFIILIYANELVLILNLEIFWNHTIIGLHHLIKVIQIFIICLITIVFLNNWKLLATFLNRLNFFIWNIPFNQAKIIKFILFVNYFIQHLLLRFMKVAISLFSCRIMSIISAHYTWCTWFISDFKWFIVGQCLSFLHFLKSLLFHVFKLKFVFILLFLLLFEFIHFKVVNIFILFSIKGCQRAFFVGFNHDFVHYFGL